MNNTDVIKQIKEVIQIGKGIDSKTRDLLLFSAIINIYEQLDNAADERVILTSRLDPLIKVGIFLASTFGVSLVALVFGLMTGRVELIFK